MSLLDKSLAAAARRVAAMTPPSPDPTPYTQKDYKKGLDNLKEVQAALEQNRQPEAKAGTRVKLYERDPDVVTATYEALDHGQKAVIWHALNEREMWLSDFPADPIPKEGQALYQTTAVQALRYDVGQEAVAKAVEAMDATDFHTFRMLATAKPELLDGATHRELAVFFKQKALGAVVFDEWQKLRETPAGVAHGFSKNTKASFMNFMTQRHPGEAPDAAALWGGALTVKARDMYDGYRAARGARQGAGVVTPTTELGFLCHVENEAPALAPYADAFWTRLKCPAGSMAAPAAGDDALRLDLRASTTAGADSQTRITVGDHRLPSGQIAQGHAFMEVHHGGDPAQAASMVNLALKAPDMRDFLLELRDAAYSGRNPEFQGSPLLRRAENLLEGLGAQPVQKGLSPGAEAIKLILDVNLGEMDEKDLFERFEAHGRKEGWPEVRWDHAAFAAHLSDMKANFLVARDYRTPSSDPLARKFVRLVSPEQPVRLTVYETSNRWDAEATEMKRDYRLVETRMTVAGKALATQEALRRDFPAGANYLIEDEPAQRPGERSFDHDS